MEILSKFPRLHQKNPVFLKFLPFILRRPHRSWPRNDVESGNLLVKDHLQFDPKDPASFIQQIQALVEEQYRNADRALISKGPFTVAEEFKQFSCVGWQTRHDTPAKQLSIFKKILCHYNHNHHHPLSLSPQPPPSITIIITTTICHYHHHHNHHHLSLSPQPPTSVTIIITTTTICNYHHHNHHHLSLSSQPPP